MSIYERRPVRKHTDKVAMESGVFKFKRFSVRNERSAMKVNTDGVLLGVCTEIEHPLNGSCYDVLDAGTGTGTIALMIAQRLSELDDNFRITGIDIDKDSAEEAAKNFANSPWANNLKSQHIALQECEGLYDLIVSNPPYFDDSLKNPDSRKKTARHTAAKDEENSKLAPMSYRSILDFSIDKLKPNGRIALILPAEFENELLRYARMCGLKTRSIKYIQTVERKAPCRLIAQFVKTHGGSSYLPDEPPYTTSNLIIQRNGKYSDEYISLLKEFYLLF